MHADFDLKGKPRRYAHFLGPAQWDYNEELAKLGDFKPLPHFYKQGFHIWNGYRENNLLIYKTSNLRIDEDEKVKIYHPVEEIACN